MIKHERSGSCGVIVLIVDTECFVANVGDSRAIMSSE
jgi:protein phosphatase 2C family protein 2/3